MFTKDQLEAVEAAIDVAYSGDGEDRERVEMEDRARQAYGLMKALAAEGKPTSKRWAIVNPSHKAAGILLSVKQVAGHSKSHKVILMPEEDYQKLYARVMFLEKQHIEDAKTISNLREESGDVEYLPPNEEVHGEVLAGTLHAVSSEADREETASMNEDPAVVKAGLFDMQVCVPAYWSDAAVEEFANEKNPTGIGSKWKIRKEGHEMLAGSPERVACTRRDQFVHIMLEC